MNRLGLFVACLTLAAAAAAADDVVVAVKSVLVGGTVDITVV